MKAFERDGKDPRVIIEEKSRPSESAVSYHAKVFTKDGDEIPEEGVALNPMGSAYKTDWTKRIPEAGLRLQRLFLRIAIRN